jgi:hypothetical protein
LGRRRKMASAVGLRHWFRLQLKRRFKVGGVLTRDKGPGIGGSVYLPEPGR